jgi:hypothetical protein
MKLDCVITSCNLNPLYIDFVPIFIKAWHKVYPTVDIKIILISETIPEHLLEYKKHIICFKPIANVSTAFISQYIRLLYPCILDYKNGILITDMDMLPMNDTYYTENIKDLSDDKFVYYRNVLLNNKEIAMCYNTAIPSTWRDIFDIHSIDDITTRLETVYNRILYVDGHGKSGWSTDQTDFYEYVMEWNKQTNNFVILNDIDTGYRRLDRIHNYNHDLEKYRIKSGYYSDYHCFRPYNQNKEINDLIVDCLPDNNFISGEKITSLCDVCIYDKKYLETYKNIRKHCKNVIYDNSIVDDNIKRLINNSKSFFVKSDHLDYFQDIIMPHINLLFILVSHNSDQIVGQHKTILSNPLLLKWYGQNILCGEKTIGIPIGLENTQWNGWDYNTCIKYKNNTKTNLLYFNFSFNNNPIRENIHQLLIKKGFIENKKYTWDLYIENMSKYKFCLSPPGNGIDCHRHWESIYVGCIPIVLKNDIIYKHFKDLPILFVENYDIITEEFLNTCYENIKNQQFTLDKTTLSYWKDKISII